MTHQVFGFENMDSVGAKSKPMTPENNFYDSRFNHKGYLTVERHTNERSKLVYDCIRHFNEKKHKIFPNESFLQQLPSCQNHLVTVYDYGAGSEGKSLQGDYHDEARGRFDETFPNGCDIIDTSGADMLCGLYAIEKSFRNQFSDLSAPTKDELIRVLPQATRMAKNNGLGEEWTNSDNFRVDQLELILRAWASDRHPGLNLRLGYVLANGEPFLVPTKCDDASVPRTLWIHSNSVSGNSESSVNHFSGLKALAAGSAAAVSSGSPTYIYSSEDLHTKLGWPMSHTSGEEKSMLLKDPRCRFM